MALKQGLREQDSGIYFPRIGKHKRGMGEKKDKDVKRNRVIERASLKLAPLKSNVHLFRVNGTKTRKRWSY